MTAPAAAPAPRVALGPSHRRWLALATVASLALYLRAVYAGPAWQVYLFKPVTTSLILVMAIFAAGSASARYRAGIVAGLCFSLLGDVALMLPGDYFIPGLVAFLVAHLCYLAAFTDRVGWRLLNPAAFGYAALATVVITPLWPSLGSLRLPVLAYMTVIMAMATQAAGRWGSMRSADSRSAATGAAVFVASDATLAIDRFGGSFAAAPLLIMSTYVAAQLLIAWSVSAEHPAPSTGH